MQAFGDYYKTISNAELIAILRNLENYQPEAVIAAQKEFKSRALSEQDIMEANEIIESAKAEKNKLKIKATAIGSSVLQTGFSVAETVSPIQKEPLTPEKIINILTIVFGGLFVISIFRNFNYLIYLLKNPRYIDIASLFDFFTDIILLIAIITFRKKKKVGWHLLSFYIIFSICSYSWLILETVGIKHSHTYSLVIKVIFYIGMLYVVCRKPLKETFAIDKRMMAASVFMSVFITMCLLRIISW